MDLETIRQICISLPGVTEDIKWGNNLCFLVSDKMFCVATLEPEVKVSIKVRPEEFDALISKDGIIPAPYAARNKWILVEKLHVFNLKKWEEYIHQSYELITSRRPKKNLL